MDSYAISKENELLANLQLFENKTLMDRTNIYTTAETILFAAFVGLMSDPKGLPGLAAWFPIIVTCTGLSFSVHWLLWSKSQIKRVERITIRLQNRKSTFETYKASMRSAESTSKYEVPPILFTIAWSLILIVYCLLATSVIAF